MDATTETAAPSALDAHVREYLESKGFDPNRMGNWDTGNGIGLAIDAVASGWHAARADLAETLRALIEQADGDVLPHLAALVLELEAGLGK